MIKLSIILMMVSQLISCQPAYAEEINVEKLATSIRKAEGNDNYGILKHIKGKNYRKACIQTIRHGLRDWNGSDDFISFLGSRYCPTYGKNLTKREKEVNIFWIKNVKFFYRKDLKNG